MTLPIENDQQYHVTKASADKFRAAIAKVEGAPAAPNVDPRLHAVAVEAMRVQLAQLEQEMRDYEGRTSKQRVEDSGQ